MATTPGRQRERRRRGNGNGNDVGVIVPGQNPIEHVIFLVKENRTLRSLLRHATPGPREPPKAAPCDCTTSDGAPGTSVRSPAAPYVQPHDITHGFSSGLYVDQRRRDERVQLIGAGQDLTGYVAALAQDRCPRYWAYADRFVLADHFFTSMYGPTFPEHLYTVAAQSYGIVDNKTNADTDGELLRRSRRSTRSASRDDLTKHDIKRIMRLEEHITDGVPDQLLRSRSTGRRPGRASTSRCFPISSRRHGISWKYYGNADAVDERSAGDPARSVRTDVGARCSRRRRS